MKNCNRCGIETNSVSIFMLRIVLTNTKRENPNHPFRTHDVNEINAGMDTNKKQLLIILLNECICHVALLQHNNMLRSLTSGY